MFPHVQELLFRGEEEEKDEVHQQNRPVHMQVEHPEEGEHECHEERLGRVFPHFVLRHFSHEGLVLVG